MIKMIVKFKTSLSMFLKPCILSHPFIIQLNFNISSLSLSYSITEWILFQRDFFFSRWIIYKLKITVFTMEIPLFCSKKICSLYAS